MKKTLNILTGGLSGTAGFVKRRFQSPDGRQTFLGRVATFVVGHAVFSLIVGTVGIWSFLKGISYILAAILWIFFGWELKPPAEEQGQAKNFFSRIEDGAQERIDKIKEKLEREKEELRLAAEQAKKRLAEKELAERGEKIRHDAEEDIAAKHRALEDKERELAARAKAEIKEHTPSPWSMIFGSSRRDANTIDIWCPSSTCGKYMYYAESERQGNAVCQSCGLDIGRIWAIAESKIPPAGQTIDTACRFCGQNVRITGDGIARALTCPKCNKAQYLCESLLAFAKKEGDDRKSDLLRRERETKLRLDLARVGIQTPLGLTSEEAALIKAYNDGPKRDRLTLRIEREAPLKAWNDYQRAGPEAGRHYMNSEGKYQYSDPENLIP